MAHRNPLSQTNFSNLVLTGALELNNHLLEAGGFELAD